MSKKTKIYLGIPSRGERSDLQMYVLRDLEKLYADKIELVYPAQCTHRMFHDFARNEVVKEFLQTDCDILWFLDSDIAPPTHVLDLVTKHGEHWELAGAPYPVFMTPDGYKGPQVVMCVYNQGAKGLHAAAVPTKGTAFVDGLATGCIFIKRGVIEQLQEPYFEFKYDPKSRIITEGEDLGFCRKVNDLGYKFFTDYSMVCKHYKQVDLLDVNNYATDYSNQAVLAYDAHIRPKVEQLVAENRELRKRLAEATGRTKSGLILPK
jgi:hypothetical protein